MSILHQHEFSGWFLLVTAGLVPCSSSSKLKPCFSLVKLVAWFF